MGITQHELNKVQNISDLTAYGTIKKYYDVFIKHWIKRSDTQKQNKMMGNGRTANVSFIDDSIEYVQNLKANPSTKEIKDLAQNVISGKLEYAYHDRDSSNIKMGAYAHYINSVLTPNSHKNTKLNLGDFEIWLKNDFVSPRRIRFLKSIRTGILNVLAPISEQQIQDMNNDIKNLVSKKYGSVIAENLNISLPIVDAVYLDPNFINIIKKHNLQYDIFDLSNKSKLLDILKKFYQLFFVERVSPTFVHFDSPMLYSERRNAIRKYIEYVESL